MTADKSKKRVLSGIQPTGRLHLGNLIGAVENWVKLQDKYDCYFFIADLHALTTAYTTVKGLKDNVREVAIDLLSAGLAPEKCVIFKQAVDHHLIQWVGILRKIILSVCSHRICHRLHKVIIVRDVWQ